MNERPKVTAELRFIVIVVIDLTDSILADHLVGTGRPAASVAEVVASEVISNLESVSYIDAVIVSPL
jgi:hypothetical protein